MLKSPQIFWNKWKEMSIRSQGKVDDEEVEQSVQPINFWGGK